MKRQLLISAVVGMVAIPIAGFLAPRVRFIDRTLSEFYLLAAAFGTVHSPNALVFYLLIFVVSFVVALVIQVGFWLWWNRSIRG